MEQLKKFEMKSSEVSEKKIQAVKNLARCLMRPFSLNELAPQVEDITKKEFEEIFALLLERGEVIMKMSGKIKIYFYNYKQIDTNDNENIEERIESNLKKWEDTRAEIRELEDLLNRGMFEIPLNELEQEVQAAKERVAKLQKAIEKAKEKKLKSQVEPQEIQSLKRKYDNYLDEYQKRKRMCFRVVDIVGDRYAKPRKTLMNDMDIQSDEQVDFNINEYKL